METTICRDIGPNGTLCNDSAKQDGYCGFHWSMQETIKTWNEKPIECEVSGSKRKNVSVIRECDKKRMCS